VNYCVKTLVVIAGVLVAVVAAGCNGPITIGRQRTWCGRVDLTTDSKGDRTRFDNTAERVLKVKRELAAESLACGADYVGVSAEAIMTAVINGQTPEGPGFIPNEDPSHCIVIYLNGNAPHPVANPLYTDGVRVYFIDDQIQAKLAQKDSKTTWCSEIPFSSDPGGDRTGIDNTDQRVARIMSALGPAVKRCPNVLSFDRALNKKVVEELKLNQRPVQGAESKTWVFKVMVKNTSDLPAMNPLFLDGVRTYFGVAGAANIPPPPPPPEIPDAGK
jgi:hypothetical protein